LLVPSAYITYIRVVKSPYSNLNNLTTIAQVFFHRSTEVSHLQSPSGLFPHRNWVFFTHFFQVEMIFGILFSQKKKGETHPK